MVSPVAALRLAALLSSLAFGTAVAQDKPNILVIWGDDIGTTNISFNNRGLMGYRTPNIDRIANDAFRSPTTTASSPAPPDGPRSSGATIHCERG